MRSDTGKRSLRPSRPTNGLLAQLPRDDFERIAPHLSTVRLRRKQVVLRAGEPIREVYFPNGGMYSVLSLLSTGACVETVTIGDEGMLGIEAFFNDDAVAIGETVTQVSDVEAEALPAPLLRRELAENAAFHALVGRFMHALVAQMMQSAACLARHPVRQRAARWLLALQDGVGHEVFQLSHEFLATMLGVSRPTVSEVAGALQREGLVSYAHGHMRLLDRDRLEAEACECYRIVRAHRARVGSNMRLLSGSRQMPADASR